jgi:ParB family chromosome partitioning protein
LDSLIEDSSGEAAAEEESREIEISRISPNPHQPRREFPEEALDELARSIREHGVLQPLLVRPAGDGFELIAGERRLRAARLAGRETVPVVVREIDDDRMLELALVENVQREDLNPIEKAEAYRSLLEELALTHQQAADRLGKSRSAITNQLRLLELAPAIQDMVSRGTLTMGHARALLAVADEDEREELAALVERDGLSVREVEERAKEGREPAEPSPAGKRPERERSAHLMDLERQLRERFATKVRIQGSPNKGKVSLEYYSVEELSRLLEILLPDSTF